jgi:hypothetical protein
MENKHINDITRDDITKANDPIKFVMDALIHSIDLKIDEMHSDRNKCYAPDYCYCDRCVDNWKKNQGLIRVA